jgi:hypothetical protein
MPRYPGRLPSPLQLRYRPRPPKSWSNSICVSQRSGLCLRPRGSLISGSTIAVLTGLPSAFCPTDLDVYTPRGGGWKVVQFFKKGGKYRVTKATSAYDFAAGIGKVFTLRHRASKKTINIIESISLNPLDAVLHFHLSCIFGAWTANHFWHG